MSRFPARCQRSPGQTLPRLVPVPTRPAAHTARGCWGPPGPAAAGGCHPRGDPRQDGARCQTPGLSQRDGGHGLRLLRPLPEKHLGLLKGPASQWDPGPAVRHLWSPARTALVKAPEGAAGARPPPPATPPGASFQVAPSPRSSRTLQAGPGGFSALGSWEMGTSMSPRPWQREPHVLSPPQVPPGERGKAREHGDKTGLGAAPPAHKPDTPVLTLPPLPRCLPQHPPPSQRCPIPPRPLNLFGKILEAFGHGQPGRIN